MFSSPLRDITTSGAADRRQVSWEDLLKKLTWIDRNSIAQVALDLVDESGQPKEAVMLRILSQRSSGG